MKTMLFFDVAIIYLFLHTSLSAPAGFPATVSRQMLPAKDSIEQSHEQRLKVLRKLITR